KQTALAISTTEAEYVSAEKACQQALLMKQALIDYGVKSDSVDLLETLRSSSREEEDSCGDPNHLIGECPKPPKEKNQRAFVGGSWSDSSEEDDEKDIGETCLMAQASSEVRSESSYFSDENSSIDEFVLDSEYDKLCKTSLKIIIKNKRLKAIRNSLENELSELKEKLSKLEKNKGVDLECTKCQILKIENKKLKEETLKLNQFEKSTYSLNEMLSNKKLSRDKSGLGFNSFEASSSGTKEIKFVKPQNNTSSGGSPQSIVGGPHKVQTTPKATEGPHVCSPYVRKFVSFHKSILGPRPKHIMVNNVKILVASDDELCLGVNLEPDEWIKDSGCSKHMMGNRKLFSTYKAYNGGNVIFGSNLRSNMIGKGQIYDSKSKVIFSENDSEIVKEGKVIVLHSKHKYYLTKFDPKSYEVVFLCYSQNSKAYVIFNKHTRKIEESLNVTLDETPPPSKTSPLVDYNLDEDQAIKVFVNKALENDIEDETLKVDEIVNIKESKNHPLENIIGNLNQRTLRSQAHNQSNFFYSMSTIEPKNRNEALKDESWIITIQEELNQFGVNDVWELVPQPKNMTIIGTKWVYRNKLDENGVVSRNKARLVAQGYNQQEGIDYDETYAPVARLESIRILLAYACALDFKLFQMDVKSAFLNGFINEEKALYGLKQAPKAWYDKLKAFLIKHEYKMGMVDNTLFTKKKSSNLIIVQIYVDDIIFGSTCQDMCDEFSKIMHDEFEMSMMGELNFFLRLQIKQMEDGIFFNQSKYIKEMLKKFGLEDSKSMKTPMSSDTKLTKIEECVSDR
ncbi:retrovirus-related pol polyprotein from transposon TNT 1-94, partial [Tanacetum coccineum]